MKKYFSALLLLNMIFILASTIIHQESISNTSILLTASREIDSFEENVANADTILKVTIGDMIQELETGGVPQTIYEATVLDVIKGNVSDTVNILQDGTRKKPFKDIPLFSKGETYLLALKETEDVVIYNDTYWILDEYYISQDSAVDMFPKPSTDSVDIEEQISSEISSQAERKANQLSFDAEVVDAEELLEKVEEEVRK